MTHTIVIARVASDLDLDPATEDAVQRVLFPGFAAALDRRRHMVIDALAWGNAVLAVLSSMREAIGVAEETRELLRETDASRLAVTILLHNSDLVVGSDSVRLPRGHHPYAAGSQLALAYELALGLPAGWIWLTPSAWRIVSDQSPVRGMALAEPSISVRVGRRVLKVCALVRAGEQLPELPPMRQEVDAALVKLRSALLRDVLELASAFRATTVATDTIEALNKAFEFYLGEALSRLQLRAKPGEHVDIDILLPDKNGQLELFGSTDPGHEQWLPGMTLLHVDGTGIPRPPENAGLAPYVIFQNGNARPGVGIAHDVHTTDIVTYYLRIDDDPGAYVSEEARMYRAHPASAGPTSPYRSILCASLQYYQHANPEDLRDQPDARAGETDREDESRSYVYGVGSIGVINVTSSEPNAFSIEDVAWADTVGLAIGDMFDAHESATRRLTDESERRVVVRTASDGSVRSTVSPTSPPRRPVFTWMHLSDIHFGAPDRFHQYDQERVLESLLEDVRIQRNSRPRPDAIFLTGDIAFSGSYEKEYSPLAIPWLKKLVDVVGCDLSALRVVPGNHDADRKVDEGDLAAHFGLRARPRTLGSHLSRSKHERRKKFEGFSRFLTDIGLGEQASLDWKEDVALSGTDGRIRIVGLCSVWVSDRYDGRDDTNPNSRGLYPNMLLCEDQYRLLRTTSDDRPLLLVLTHHPREWLSNVCAAELEKQLTGTHARSIHLAGHVHVPTSACSQQFGRSGDSGFGFTTGAAHAEHAETGESSKVGHGYSWGSIAWSRTKEEWQVGWAPRMYQEQSVNRFTFDPTWGDPEADGYIWNRLNVDWNHDDGL